MSSLDRPVYQVWAGHIDTRLGRVWRKVDAGYSRYDLSRPGVFKALCKIHGRIKVMNSISGKVYAEHV